MAPPLNPSAEAAHSTKPGSTAGHKRPTALSLSVILVVACLPSLLVFGDRWLGDQSVNDLLMAIWCRLPSACLGPWPPAILLIVAAALALWRGWAGPLAAHILLVLTLFTSVDRSPAAPALAILAVSAHILLWRTRRSTITPAFWLTSLSLVLTSLYFRAWWFSAIGDEYGFYTFAAGLLAHADLTSIGAQLYNPSRVYTTHPGFSSLIQVASMAVFGPGLFGWRFSNLYLAALSLWPFYVFVEVIGGRRLAILAATLLAF